MGDLAPVQRDNIICLVDEAHRSHKGKGNESYAMTMRVKLPGAFRFGFTGTPIDRTMTNTHRDFGPEHDGKQERYLSYYGIKRSIKDGNTLEVHYIRDQVPFEVDEEMLSVGYEQMCEEMELEDEEAKDFVQRRRARWKTLATHPDRVDIVLDKVLDHFLEHPDPSGFKAQLVVVDRTACAIHKKALDAKLAERGLPAEWCDVIISTAQNSEPLVAEFEYAKQKQDDLIDDFKLTDDQWLELNRERFGDEESKWRPPLKILIVCDRLLTGFDAPIEQVMYLDRPLRDHNLLQAVARTNRPFPALKKLTGIVVDYFGVFANMQKALNFDENIIEESLIDWDRLRSSVAGEVARCMEQFEGITIEDTRDCLLAALRRLKDPDAGKVFEQNFKSLERLWEAVAPDPALYPHRHEFNWLCGIYVAYRRRKRGSKATYGELSAKTRQLIEGNTIFIRTAEALPVFRIDKDYVTKVDQFPSPSDKAAALEAALTAELTEGDPGFVYRQLGERMQAIKNRKDKTDEATAEQLRLLDEIAVEIVKAKSEPERLGLTKPGEHGLYTVLRAFAATATDEQVAECARKFVAHLRQHDLLPVGWSNSTNARMRVEQSLLVESWNPDYAILGFAEEADPPFLKPAVDELVKSDVE